MSKSKAPSPFISNINIVWWLDNTKVNVSASYIARTYGYDEDKVEAKGIDKPINEIDFDPSVLVTVRVVFIPRKCKIIYCDPYDRE